LHEWIAAKKNEGTYVDLDTDVATMLLSLCKHLKVCSEISDPDCSISVAWGSYRVDMASIR